MGLYLLMKQYLLIALIILASAEVGRSQCAPPNPTGNIGFFPSTDLLPCVDRGVYYDETFFLENVDSFRFQGFGTLTVDTFRIDSIVNLPCNLNWLSDRGDNTYYRAETGCIRIFGVTDDSVGQYELKVYVTIKSQLLGTLQGDLNQIVTDLQNLAGNLGIDFEYFVRVKESASNCPNIDRGNNSPLARTAEKTCAVAGFITAEIDGDTELCSGDNGQLNVSYTNATNPAISWTPANAVSNPNIANPDIALTQSGYVTVEVTDTANTGNTFFDRVWVQIDSIAPVAAFAITLNGQSVKLEASPTPATSYAWTLGDQTSATTPVVLHTYAADGIYPVSLTVTNSCGTDTYLDTINIGNVGISTLENNSLQCTITPNPAKGHVQIELQGLTVAEIFTVTILDLTGKEMMKPLVHQHQPSNKLQMPVDALQPGIYIFQIKTLHSSTFQKIIIY